jgi:hypothetical protein
MRRLRFVVVGLLLAGRCGSNGPGVLDSCPLPRDGTRLKAVRIQADDGASEDRSRYGQWYDTQLGVYCSFEMAVDETLRCLPRVAPPWVNLFADGACSERVAFGGLCLTPAYVSVPLQNSCAGADEIFPTAVYALGAGSVPDVLYAQETDAAGNVSCAANQNSDRRQVFPLLSELPPTQFVGATIERTSGSRIQAGELAAADGARGRHYTPAFDSTLGTECDVALAADDEWRCLPLESLRYVSSAFADTACTQRLVGKPERRCAPTFAATYAGVEEFTTCPAGAAGQIRRHPPRSHVHELDPPSTPANIYQQTYGAGSSAICEGTANIEAWQYARLRAELPPTQFARADMKEASCGPLGRSGRRLKAYHRVFDDGSVLGTPAFGSWVDVDTGQDCFFAVATDDVLRCLPRGQAFAVDGKRYFAEAGCSRPLLGVDRCPDRPLGPPKFAVSDEAGGACTAAGYVDFRRRVYALGAAVTPSVVYVHDDSALPARCVPIDELGFETSEQILEVLELRELGSEVPPATFVAGSIDVP